MRRCESLSSLKSLFWYVPQLSGARILNPLMVHVWGWLQWLRACRPVCLHPEFPKGSQSGVAVVPDGCNILCLLICQATFFIHNAIRDLCIWSSPREINSLQKIAFLNSSLQRGHSSTQCQVKMEWKKEKLLEGTPLEEEEITEFLVSKLHWHQFP